MHFSFFTFFRCGSRQEGGRLSGDEDGAAPEALRLSPVPETAGLCIPHGLPCSLPPASPGAKKAPAGACDTNLSGRADPRALTRKVAGCLELKMAPTRIILLLVYLFIYI